MADLTAPITADVPDKFEIHNFTTSAAIGDRLTLELFLTHWPKFIDAKDEKTWTALMHASWAGQEEIVVMLLQWGANAGEKDRFDRTARWFASQNGYLGIVALLQAAVKRS